MLRSDWTVNGRAATALELMQAMALARAYAARQRQSHREARELEQAARAVGRSSVMALAVCSGRTAPFARRST